MPRISVVMPSYESASYLRQAVDSVLQQTERDIELIIVQEIGARDGTEALLNEIDDARVRVVRNNTPLGLARSLNRGFALAAGEYIARMDATDIALSERLEKQARYLDKHFSVGAIGSAVRRVDPDGREMRALYYPTAPAIVLWGMHFGPSMCPTSAMFRRSAFEQAGGFSTKADFVEYELLCRIMRYHGLANVPDLLMEHRNLPTEASENVDGIVDSARRTIEVTVGRPVDHGFVRALLFPETINDRRDAIGAAWLLNTIVRSYRMWYRDRTREEGILVKEDAAAKMSYVLARSIVAAPIGAPMILWHTTRAGPGVTYRTARSSLERGIERLGRSSPTGEKKRASSARVSRM
jgi:glycosyltransferase involved in cell wall biosynthesis